MLKLAAFKERYNVETYFDRPEVFHPLMCPDTLSITAIGIHTGFFSGNAKPLCIVEKLAAVQ